MAPSQILAASGVLVFAGAFTMAGQGCTVLSNDEPTCNECEYQACIGQWAVCGHSTECMAIYTCTTAESCDQSCIDQCYLAHPMGQASYYALASCDALAANSSACSSLCPASVKSDAAPDTSPDTNAPDSDVDADVDADMDADMSETSTADSSAPDSSTAPDSGTVQGCSDCVAQKCPNEKAACAAGTQCDLYTDCLGGCGSAACVDQCGIDRPNGKTASVALGACVTQNCSPECGLGQ